MGHFTEVEGDEAKCNECQLTITFKDGTNKMKGHLQKEHKVFKEKEETKKPKKDCPQQEKIESAMYFFKPLNLLLFLTQLHFICCSLLGRFISLIVTSPYKQ
jgi:hypothetical protein